MKLMLFVFMVLFSSSLALKSLLITCHFDDQKIVRIKFTKSKVKSQVIEWLPSTRINGHGEFTTGIYYATVHCVNERNDTYFKSFRLENPGKQLLFVKLCCNIFYKRNVQVLMRIKWCIAILRLALKKQWQLRICYNSPHQLRGYAQKKLQSVKTTSESNSRILLMGDFFSD